MISNNNAGNKIWAAIKDEAVIGHISMLVPNHVDFEEYRRRAVACLELLGDVKSGEIVISEGKTYFALRPNHQNRSKQPPIPKLFEIKQ